MTRYYRRFVNNYAHRTAPITDVLKKNYFQWNDETKKCFEALKNMMSLTLLLATHDFRKPFVVVCDALGFKIRAVLMQEGHPIELERRNVLM